MPSTWRSYQSVNASSPQSCRERSSRPLDVPVEHARHRLGSQVALPAQRLRRERLAGERLELAAQPRRGGDREAALAAVNDLAGKQRLDRIPQQPLLLEARAPSGGPGARTRSSRRPCRGTARGSRATTPSRHGRSSRAGRRRDTRRGRRPEGAPAARSPPVSANRARSTANGSAASRRPVSSARASAEKISFQPSCRSSGGRWAARTKRLAR